MKDYDLISAKSLLPQFFSHTIAVHLGEFIIWSYYYIILYQLTGSFEILLIEFIFYALGIWIGFVICSFTLDRFGYLNLFRTATLIQGISFVITIIIFNDILNVFIFIALFRGFGRGLFWPAHHSFKLKEVTGSERAELINTLQAVILLLGIAIPVLAGALLEYTMDFRYSLAVGSAVMFFTALIPFKINKRARSRISSSEISKIIGHKYFRSFAILHFINDSFTQLLHILFLIIPYILIGNIFGVGVLLSFIGLAAALSALMERKKSLQQRIKMGYFSFFLHLVLSIFLSVFWSVSVLVLRSMCLPIMVSLGFTVREDLDYQLREKILGDFKNESAIEMNLVVESIFILSRVVVGFAVIVFLEIFNNNSEEFLRVSIAVAAIAVTIGFYFFKKFNEDLKLG